MTILAKRSRIATRDVVYVPLTWQDGWTWYHTMRSPGLIRSNEALAGWKTARAQHVTRDVDYE